MDQKKFRWVFGGIATVIILGLSAPLIYSAAIGALSGLAILVTGILVVGIIQCLPWLGQMLENRILEARKREARQHQIAQQQNFMLFKAQKLEEFSKAVAAMGGQITTRRAKIAERKKTIAGYDPTEAEARVQSMIEKHAFLTKTYKQAEKAFNDFKLKIEDDELDFSFNQAGKLALGSLAPAGKEEQTEELLANEASRSLAEELNATFAQLELNTNDITFEPQSAKQVEYAGNPQALSFDYAPEKVGVSR